MEPRVGSASEGHRLLDRERDLQTIDAAVAAVADSGSLLLIEGPAGIGKTALLDYLRGRVTAAGMTVLGARGSEPERGFGFGIVRQLLEGAVLGADSAERDRLLAGAARLAEPVFTDVEAEPNTADIAFATLHGLYWLVANLAERGPSYSLSMTRTAPTGRPCGSFCILHPDSPVCRCCWPFRPGPAREGAATSSPPYYSAVRQWCIRNLSATPRSRVWSGKCSAPRPARTCAAHAPRPPAATPS
ncbi:ATP-binding protein [Mycobacterium rufum]|uniref:ATP-binding protein n=1 Tax=Mycolicibacterium rufum TaxID=318424 RepID=A0A9X3BKJ6_9MYCO|nr:ATP-binding protein [Mycolicibacterium rufum]